MSPSLHPLQDIFLQYKKILDPLSSQVALFREVMKTLGRGRSGLLGRAGPKILFLDIFPVHSLFLVHLRYSSEPSQTNVLVTMGQLAALDSPP